MQIRTFWKAREQTRKIMLNFARQPQYSVIFVGRKLGRFGVPGFCVVCLLCLSTRPWGGPPRSGAPQGLGIGNIMLVMQGKPNFQRITGVTSRSRRQTWVLERAEKHPHDHDTRDNFFLNNYASDKCK